MCTFLELYTARYTIPFMKPVDLNFGRSCTQIQMTSEKTTMLSYCSGQYGWQSQISVELLRHFVVTLSEA